MHANGKSYKYSVIVALSLLFLYNLDQLYSFRRTFGKPKSLHGSSILLQEKIKHIDSIILGAKDPNTKCIKILFYHNQKAGGTTIRRFFEYDKSEREDGRKFTFIGVRGKRTKNYIDQNNWKHLISSEMRNPMKIPFLSIEVHTTTSIIHDFIPSWRRLNDIYVQQSCLVFTFTHMRNPSTHILSVYNQNLGIKRSPTEFVAPYWHNIISCGLRNPTLNFFFDPLYYSRRNKFGDYHVLPTERESAEALNLSRIFLHDLDFVANMKDLAGLFAILHQLYNSSVCAIQTAKTRNHDRYMGDKSRIANLEAILPIRLCKMQGSGYSPSTYNQRLEELMPKRGYESIDSRIIEETYEEDLKIYGKVMQLYMHVSEYLRMKLSAFVSDCAAQIIHVSNIPNER